MFGVPATVISGNDSHFVGSGNRKKKTGTWTPTLFENELLNLKIRLINSRPYHLQIGRRLGMQVPMTGSPGKKRHDYNIMQHITAISSLK